MNVHAAFVHSARLLVLALLPSLAMAQQQPLTGQMMDGYRPAAAVLTAQPPSPPVATIPTAPAPPAAVAAPTSRRAAAPDPAQQPQPLPDDEASYAPEPADATAAGQPAFHAAQVGDTTSRLLQMQADSLRAGQPLPMLGDEASAGYRRYLKSFDHEIPEFYEVAVGKDKGNGR